jgi:hypothetical protein
MGKAKAKKVDLIALQIAIESHLVEIEKLFKRGAKLTLVVRIPGNDEADVVLTTDDLDEAIHAIGRRKGDGS